MYYIYQTKIDILKNIQHFGTKNRIQENECIEKINYTKKLYIYVFFKLNNPCIQNALHSLKIKMCTTKESS